MAEFHNLLSSPSAPLLTLLYQVTSPPPGRVTFINRVATAVSLGGAGVERAIAIHHTTLATNTEDVMANGVDFIDLQFLRERPGNVTMKGQESLYYAFVVTMLAHQYRITAPSNYPSDPVSFLTTSTHQINLLPPPPVRHDAPPAPAHSKAVTTKHTPLPRTVSDRLTGLINGLSVGTRSRILRICVLCYDHAESYPTIIALLSHRLSQPFPTSACLLAYTWLLSDLLYNSSLAGVKHAWAWRDCIMPLLPEVAKCWRTTLESLGILRKEMFKREVEKVVGVWEKWSVVEEEVMLSIKQWSEAIATSAVPAAMTSSPVSSDDSDIDGLPMSDDGDDSDIDGEPM